MPERSRQIPPRCSGLTTASARYNGHRLTKRTNLPVPEPQRPNRKRRASDEATVSALAAKARVPREYVQRLYDEEMTELESTSDR